MLLFFKEKHLEIINFFGLTHFQRIFATLKLSTVFSPSFLGLGDSAETCLLLFPFDWEWFKLLQKHLQNLRFNKMSYKQWLILLCLHLILPTSEILSYPHEENCRKMFVHYKEDKHKTRNVHGILYQVFL